MIFAGFAVIYLMSIMALYFFKNYSESKDLLLDKPKARSAHTVPVPRGGGIIFVFWGLVITTFFAWQEKIEWPLWLSLVPSGILVGIVAFLDDYRHVHISIRLLAYLVAAALFVGMIEAAYEFSFIMPHAWYIDLLVDGFLIFCILWSINLYNFMDGVDGLAAIEGLFIFGVGGWWLYASGGDNLAIIMWLLSAALLGFLCWNWAPAKVFMGDVGSTFLGFLIAALAVLGQIKYHIPMVLWLIVYGVFIFDATVTLLRRFIAGEQIYKTHRLQAIHRLHDSQWSHTSIVVGVIFINILLSSLATAAFYYPQLTLLAVVVSFILLSSIYCMIEVIKPMYPKMSSQI